MSKDQYGCPLSTENPEVIDSVNLFSFELLSLGKKADCILEAVEKYPNEVILHIYATIFYLYGQTSQTQSKASQHLDKASRLLDRANDREKSLYSFAWQWLHHLLTEALKNIERHCFKWPKDLTAIKITEFLFYCKGQKYESKRFLRLTSHCYYEHQNNPFFLAIHSFALELSAKYEESLETAKRALQFNEENPWAHHTLSHVYFNKGLINEGIHVLEHYAPLWSHFNHAIESHNLWHLALLYLENLDFEKIQDVYQRANWLDQTQLVSEEIDATGLLWRLEMEEQLDPLYWQKLAESIGDHANFGGTPFISALLCYALKKGNREESLQQALEQIENFAHDQIKEDRFVWKEIGLSLIYGSLAYADKDYARVLQYFDPILSYIDCGGGDDIQIDLFYQTYLKSLMGVQRYGDAEALLHKRTQGRDLTKLERKWLMECQDSSTYLLRHAI